MSIVIDVQGLTKSFGTQFALRNISFTVKKGTFLTIFGPNGAGKTTLIRILSTLSKPSSGEVHLTGKSVKQQAQKIRRHIGVIAHQTFLYENLTAAENLRFYGRLYDVPQLQDSIDRSLADVGLAKRRNDRVRTFSRGMQQRLSIARAMLHQPDILLLDEPYTGLDQHASEMLSEWLKRLRNSDRTTLMVTHDLERGIDMADRVAVLAKGQLIYEEMRENIDIQTFKQTYYDLVGTGRVSVG